MRSSEKLCDVPVVMATAKGAEYDKIHGLDMGADYYLVKPFGVLELIVKAVLRALPPRHWEEKVLEARRSSEY